MKFEIDIMIESLRIFGLLLHKCWLISKKHWMTNLIGEMLVPVSLILGAWAVSYNDWTNEIEVDFRNETHYKSRSFEQLLDLMNDEPNHMKILFAPSNSFTDKLMIRVTECLRNKTNIIGFDAESDLVTNSSNESNLSPTIAIVFDESADETTKHLRYKLLSKEMQLYDLYNFPWPDGTPDYHPRYFLQVQICLDRSYLKIKSNETAIDIPEVFIQQVPYPAYTKPGILRSETGQMHILFFVGAFTIPLFFEISKSTNEKFVGINVLMSTNGISNALNLLSWIISGISLLSLLCIISVSLLATLSMGSPLPFLSYGNPLILLVVLILYFGHSITFIIHLSAYFSKSFHLTYALIITYSLATLLYTIISGKVTHYLIPYVGMIFPLILLYRILEEIDSYETMGIGIQWSNLFTNINPFMRIGGSIGMVMTLSVLGMFFHYWLAVYIYAINPGKYGIGKHVLFFLMRKIKGSDEDIIENVIFDNKSKYFEPTTAKVCTPTIQIRNLKKTYDVGIFNKEKAHALKGISIDFYKGGITSILGHNGAGKSTLMSILTGAISPTDGLILVNSKIFKDNTSELLKDIGYYTQDIYFPNLTVKEQLEFVALIKKQVTTRSIIESNVITLIQKLKLLNVKDCLANKLPEDQKHKLCLGMAIVGDPNTLILDEPTSHLDHENKRIIWDILLGIKGQKTILLSTHDMEEADILGDRIAIMREGRLKSFGTSLFLKNMITGQKNTEVSVSIERWSDPEDIRKKIHSEARIIEKQDKKIIVSVPITSTLLELLEDMVKKRSDLGASAYKLSHLGLEQVFLNVADNDDGMAKPSTVKDKLKLKGIALYLQLVKALFAKKFNYALKDFKTLFVQVLAIVIGLLGTSIIFIIDIYAIDTGLEIVDMHLGMYDKPYTVYTSFDETIGNRYTNTSVNLLVRHLLEALKQTLTMLANENLIHYNNHLIAAAEFDETVNGLLTVNAFYSNKISYSLPISINLLSNTIIQNILGRDYCISISAQLLKKPFDTYSLEEPNEIISHIAASIFAVPIYLTIATFAVHPCRESLRGLKQLQKMTGVSGFTYWGTMFLSDLGHYAFLVVLSVIGFIIMDYSLDLQMYGITEIMLTILLMMLFAVNVLPLVYCSSFIRAKTNFVLKLFTFTPMGIVIIESMMFSWRYTSEVNEKKYFITRFVYLILPYVSFLNGHKKLLFTGASNGFCRRFSDDYYEFNCKGGNYWFCCEESCHGKQCRKLISYFLDNDIDSLKVSVIYLCTAPVIYFSILALLESQLIKKIIAKFAKRNVKESDLDEDLRHEKSVIFQKIEALKENRSSENIAGQVRDTSVEEFFLAHELVKHYRKAKAVEDVSFMIKKCECFGILGINRPGKSTIFKMITGQEIPDHGTMYIEDNHFKENIKKFVAQIGYCPQYDATLKCLNSYDHLRLFARLRGIPEEQVEDEVQAWIDRLNLNGCASLLSGTLSSGNNQRLNIAMALIGKPNLVLLDEPTTRVDPGARRSFWKIVKSCQMAGQTFLLASQNVEECEALCKKMAIMVDGTLICIGTPEKLKQRFGAGYDVQIRVNTKKVKHQLDRIKKDMRYLLNCVLTDENPGYLMYRVIGAGTTWSKIYGVMDKIKKKYDCIDDFVVVVRLSA